jgi:hypothetical protein
MVVKYHALLSPQNFYVVRKLTGSPAGNTQAESGHRKRTLECVQCAHEAFVGTLQVIFC